MLFKLIASFSRKIVADDLYKQSSQRIMSAIGAYYNPWWFIQWIMLSSFWTTGARLLAFD